MTAIRPAETRRVRGVSSERYPLNRVSAHPESDKATDDPHHIFARSFIIGDSWFVSLTFNTEEEARAVVGPDVKIHYQDGEFRTEAIPHVAGLSRDEHEAVEQHRAWIKLENGVFNWYDRQPPTDPHDELPDEWTEWVLAGELNPQPGSVEGKPKRKKRAKQPARPGQMFSCRVPKDEAENGLEVLNELLDANRDRLADQMGWTDSVPNYFVLVAVLAEGLQ